MIMMKNFNDIIDYTMGEFEYNKFFTMCNWHDGGESKAAFYLLGNVCESSNPYAYAQEQQCAHHIVRKVGTGIDEIHVIRDDCTCWTIHLSCFKEVTPLRVKMGVKNECKENN